MQGLMQRHSLTVDGFLSHAQRWHPARDGKIATWWMPDHVVFVAEVPLGPTGKIDKKKLRSQLAGLIPSVTASGSALPVS